MIEIDNTPTQEELDGFFDVLQWIIDWHKKYEPYATQIIDAAETVSQQMPYEAEELGVIEWFYNFKLTRRQQRSVGGRSEYSERC